MIIALLPFMVGAQADTIEVARNFKTILSFPSNYDFAVNGKKLNFKESFPKGTSSQTARSVVFLSYNDISLDAYDSTNYTVYTKDGFAYDFILVLVDRPERARWSFTRDMADNLDDIKMVSSGAKKLIFSDENLTGPIEVENPYHQFKNGEGTGKVLSDKTSVKSITTNLYETDKDEYIRARCYYNQFNRPMFLKHHNRNGDIYLSLKGIYYDREEFYFQFVLENKSGIDYDVNFLKTFIKTTLGRTENSQTLPFPEDYRYKVPKRVKRNTENYFVLVFEKFSLDKSKDIVVELDEEKGSRNITLEIPYFLVNKAKAFKK